MDKRKLLEDFFGPLKTIKVKDNSQEIIEWCENEIKEYKKLIKIIKGAKK